MPTRQSTLDKEAALRWILASLSFLRSNGYLDIDRDRDRARLDEVIEAVGAMLADKIARRQQRRRHRPGR